MYPCQTYSGRNFFGPNSKDSLVIFDLVDVAVH